MARPSLAAFGWGVGFFAPPVFLSMREARAGRWRSSRRPSPCISSPGPRRRQSAWLYRRLGAPRATKVAALCLAGGAWAGRWPTAPWQLFVAGVIGGIGWGGMSAAALNAIVAPWFVRSRPVALAMAYNGASVGGIILSPLWVVAIGTLGFPLAAASIGLVIVVTTWFLADRVFSHTRSPWTCARRQRRGTLPASVTSTAARPLPGRLLWRDRRFLTLAAGMTLGLFAQVGLMAHLFSLLAPALGAQQAGLAMGLITAMAIAGRTALGWAMPLWADRRLVACASYAAQLAGSVVSSPPAPASRFSCSASCCSGWGSAMPRRCRRSSPRWSSRRTMCSVPWH